MKSNFLDCFDKELKDGDDVIISINDVLYCGIILEMTDECFIIDYQTWKGEEEIIKSIKYYNYDMINGKFLNIFKIR